MSPDCLLSVAIFSLTIGFTLSQNNTTGCSQEACARCTSKGCVKCSTLIVYPSRECVEECPFGYIQKRSTFADFIGKICQHNGNFLGLSNNSLAVLTGVATGIILCTFLLTAAALYVKYKRRNATPSSDTSSELDDTPERKEFVKQLETLRPYAQTYLEMMNDTRRQIRELRTVGDGSATGAYRPVVRDLAKILLLLNRPADRACMPDDWEHLFGWAEKALRRYKRMSETSLLQVAQLVDFLQPPMSTFKPEAGSSLQDLAVRAINGNYDSGLRLPLNPQWKFECALVDGPASEFDPTSWSKEVLNNTLLLDDDFYQLGFRPQDEITTEL